MKKSTALFVKLLVLLIFCISISMLFSGCCLKHDYIAVVTAPTCTEGGYTTHTCSKCGDTYTDEPTEALGHDYEETVVDPTCAEEGYTLHKCTRCGDSYTTDPTEKLEHRYLLGSIAPTCLEEGYTYKKCSLCGDLIKLDTSPALGHDYAETVIVAATCKSGGTHTMKCKRCGDSYTEDYVLSVLASEEIYERAKSSVGELKIYDKKGIALGLGSCFAIGDAKFVTNYHVIEKGYSGNVTVNGKKFSIIKVLAFDKDRDIAVIEASGSGAKNVPALPICHEIASGGATVYAVGSSEGLTYSFTSGVVASPDRVINGVHYVQNDASISNGNSGGPLFNVYGEVIGINTWSLTSGQNINFAISTRELDNLDYSNPITMSGFAVTYGPYFPVEPKDKIIEEKEENDYIEDAQPLNENGITVHGTLSKSSDGDVYKITLAPGETLTLIAQSKTTDETRGILCLLLEENSDAIDQAYVSTYNNGAVATLSFKNRSESSMTFYIGVTYRSAYTNKNKPLEYWLFAYKKAGTVDKYDYVNEDIGLHFKAPTNWTVEDSSGYLYAEEFSTGSNVLVGTSQLTGMTAEEYIDILNSSIKSAVSQSGLTVSISSPKTTKLGGAELKMETITMSYGGVSRNEYIYYTSDGDTITIIQITIYDDTPLSTFEAMFS